MRMQDQRIAEFLQLLEGDFLFSVLHDHVISWQRVHLRIDGAVVSLAPNSDARESPATPLIMGLYYHKQIDFIEYFMRQRKCLRNGGRFHDICKTAA
jgi:hypothetical protein